MITTRKKHRLILIYRFSIYFLFFGLAIFLTNCISTGVKRYKNAEQAELARFAEQKALERGKEIWFNPETGTNGFSCESCHTKGDMTKAESYPRYKHVLGTMATISMTHNFAVVNESDGDPWELGSEDANALVLYVKSLANGKSIYMAWPQKFKNEWINRGKSAFTDPTLDSSDKTCESCHQGGGKKSLNREGVQIPSLKGVAATYPKYSFNQQRVITLEQQINYCLEKHLNGNPLPLDDETIVALCCYLTSLSERKKVAVAKID